MTFKKLTKIVCALFILSQLPLASVERAVYEQPEKRFCRYENGQWLFCGRNQAWWNENHPGVWEKYGVITRWNDRESFPDVSEQEWTSGFERSVYNSPK